MGNGEIGLMSVDTLAWAQKTCKEAGAPVTRKMRRGWLRGLWGLWGCFEERELECMSYVGKEGDI